MHRTSLAAMAGRSIFVLFSCCVFVCIGYKAEKPSSLCCGINEEKRCLKTCPPEITCRTRGIQFSCLNDNLPCQDKCVCKRGYYRNAVGDCLTNAQCDQCPGNNEYFACSVACDNECSMLHIQNKTNCPIINIVCNPKCYCEDGFARDKENCIPIEKCPQPKVAKQNEVYTECKRSCPPETCLSLVARFKCDSNQTCEAGWSCQPGYLRKEADSPCIPLCECDEIKNSPDCPSPRCSGENEIYNDNKVSCPPEVCFSIVAFYSCEEEQLPEPGCECKPGHLRKHMNSTCIPLCECNEMKNAPECKSKQSLKN